jgi:putative membrane protein
MRNRLYGALAATSAVATLSFVTAANAQGYGQGYGPGMMGGYGPGYGMMGGYGFGIAHLVFWAIVLVAIVVGIVWLVRSMTGSGAQHHPPKRSVGLEALEERYARGEINREEYLQKKKDIAG